MTTRKINNRYDVKSLEKRFGRMTVAMFLKSMRTLEGKTQIEFADFLGISKANLCDIEKGRTLVSPRRAAELSAKLGIEESFLIQLSLEDSLRHYDLDYKVAVTA